MWKLTLVYGSQESKAWSFCELRPMESSSITYQIYIYKFCFELFHNQMTYKFIIS